jgi:Methyltransferase domain
MTFDLMRDEARMGPAIRKGLVAMCMRIHSEENRDVIYSSDGIMFEIGSYAGESAEIFSPFFDEVHCVDPWADLSYFGVAQSEDVEREFDRRTTPLGNVFKHKGTSRDWVAQTPDESIDFVYIDALHDYHSVLQDIGGWWPKVKKGGWIGGHDYLPQNVGWSKVAEAVDVFFKGKLPEVFPDSSWLMRKE